MHFGLSGQAFHLRTAVMLMIVESPVIYRLKV